MNQELKKIIELARIDYEIDSFGPKEESLKSELNKLVGKAAEIKAKIESLNEEAKECRFKIAKHDTHLKELSAKLADISKKSSTLKTERVLCPNCHAMSPNYKALNKNSGRKYRKVV